MRKPELLAPAGTMEKLKMAVLYGADAVYLGGKSYGLRAFGGNFSHDGLREGIAFAHAHNCRAYVTVNIFPRNGDLDGLPEYLRFLREEARADAALIADLGVFQIARDVVPELPIHVSTQANNLNWRTVQAWQQMGAKRVVLARELSLAEIREIRAKCSVELELFVHGAMCIAYSGRCAMSNYLAGRDANRGGCAQACRWRYSLVEEKRPGQYFPVLEDERGTYVFNSKDLCLLPYLDQVVSSGVDSLKIEGRMKSVHYAASVTKAYRMALDACLDCPSDYKAEAAWMEELNKVSHRPYTSGFFFHTPTGEDHVYGSAQPLQASEFVGLVLDCDADGLATVEQRNPLAVGDEIEIFSPDRPLFRQRIGEMSDAATGLPLMVAPHAQQLVKIPLNHPVAAYSILRRDA